MTGAGPLARAGAAARLTRTRQGGIGGYTLLELLVSVALGMVLLGLVMRWSLGLTTAAAKGIANGNQGDLALATDRFTADLLAAVPCAPLASPLRGVGADGMSVTADLDGNGALELVSWRISGGSAQRAVDALAGCSVPGAPGFVVLADGVTGSLLPVLDGEPSSDPAWQGACVDVLEPRCRIQAFSLTLAREDGGGWSQATARIGSAGQS